MRIFLRVMIWIVPIVAGGRYSAAQPLKLMKASYFPNFSSASGMDFHENKIYVFGDDSPMMIVLDTAHRLIDSFRIFPGAQRRINWEIKPDIESAFVRHDKDQTIIYGVGSFSNAKRNKVVAVHLEANGKPRAREIIEAVLSKGSLEEINIEAAASVRGRTLLGNRANNTHRTNYLLVMHNGTSANPLDSSFKAIPLRLRKVGKVVGLSGICYLAERDMLLFTASTEDTPDANTDGAIGESYVGYIKHISAKLHKRKIRARKMLPLSLVLNQNTPQKIESITTEGGRQRIVVIHLATDNDNGSSNIYKLQWRL